MRSWRRIGGVAVLLVVGLGSCCDEPELEVRDMGGRLDFGVDWAVRVKFDASMQFSFDGDFAAWGKFSAVSAATLKVDLSGLLTYRRRMSVDVDNDGVKEAVRMLAAGGTDPSNPERVLVAWRGDAYTFDADRCYVMWWEGSKLELLNGRCGSTEPALHCQMTKGKSDTLSCDVCGASGICAPCEASAVSACIVEGTKELKSPPSTTTARGGSSGSGASAGGIAGSAGLAGMAGTAGVAGTGAIAAGTGGVGVAAAGGTQNSGSVGTSVSVSVEFDTCVSQVRYLASLASGCTKGALRSTNVLCSDRLADVNVCYVSVQGAGLFVSKCDVLGSTVCRGVFP